MTDVVHQFLQKSVNFQYQHAAAAQLALARADDGPLLDKVLPLLVDPSPELACAPRWKRGDAPRDAIRSALYRFEIEASAIDRWLRGTPDILRSEAGKDDDVGARWAALDRMEREASQIGRSLMFDREYAALTRLPLLSRILVVHVTVLLEMQRAYYGDHRGGLTAADVEACFASYAETLRFDLATAVTDRLASIGVEGGGITDPWTTEVLKNSFHALYAKMRVNDSEGSELQYYIARALRDFTLDSRDQVVDLLRRCAAATGAPEPAWYAAPHPLHYGDVVQLLGGSPWPLVSGGAVGETGVLQEEASGSGWTLTSATDRPIGSEVCTGEPLHLRSPSGGRFLHDVTPGHGTLLGDAPQSGGSFFLRAMEMPPGQVATTRHSFFLVGVHSGAYLQATPDGDLLLRPWIQTSHAGPDFPTWCFEEPVSTAAPTPARMSDRDLTLSVLGTLSNVPGNIGTGFGVLGAVVGLLWPSSSAPTWSEIEAYFTQTLRRELARTELAGLSQFIDGIDRRLVAYSADVKKYYEKKQEQLIGLATTIKGINDTLLQELSRVLYPVNASQLATLPYFWKVARYKLCVIKEIWLYGDIAAVDTQHQIDAFVDEARPVIIKCIDDLMRYRMNAISSTPVRYNEGFGVYHLRFFDSFAGHWFNVPIDDFRKVQGCSVKVDWDGYNRFAQEELARHRRSMRDAYMRDVTRMQVDPFNAMTPLTSNEHARRITLTSSGNDDWWVR